MMDTDTAKRKVLVILSGGLDSTVLATYLVNRGHEVHALTIDYGQRHRIEIHKASNICKHLGIPQQILDLRMLIPAFSSSALIDGNKEIPDGHYTDPSMSTTIVPNRNMVMLSVATALAVNIEADAVAYGAHAGDHPIYPDCRPEFIKAMESAMMLSSNPGIVLLAPFISLTKRAIVEIGAELSAPMGMTWSCYKGEAVHCGTCGTCVERREAFELAKIKDPTIYKVDQVEQVRTFGPD